MRTYCGGGGRAPRILNLGMVSSKNLRLYYSAHIDCTPDSIFQIMQRIHELDGDFLHSSSNYFDFSQNYLK
jgi:hypothetical protein